jgi:superfamily I DNA/RNA helicase
MKFTFKKVLYDELNIDLQKIYDLIVQKTGKDDFNALCDEFADNAESYLSQTHDLNSLFDSYDLVVFSNDLFRDNGDVLECIVDNFYVFLRDKFGF